MKLGSALSVIRYNDGFRGIYQLYELLVIEITDEIRDAFARYDSKRVTASIHIPIEQKKRYVKAETWAECQEAIKKTWY